jgi:hypothetical protein
MGLITCQKCGKQFYGTDCPECDFPSVPADPGQRKRDRLWGVLMVGIGLGLAAAVLASPKKDLPSWPAFVAAGIFCLAGFATAADVKRSLAFTLGGLICAGMASLGFFAAFGRGESQGGIPFLPESWNQGLGRIAFGFGACLTTAFAMWWFYRAIKQHRRIRH